MTPRARIGLGVVVGMFVAVTIVAAQSKDPFVGTWVLNSAKSKYSPGPAPKSGTTTIEASGSGYKMTVHQATPSGAQDWSIVTNLDGKPAKVVGTNSNADMIAYRRVDAHTLESVQSKGGKETQRQKIVVSADGKTRTVTSTGVDGAGQKVNNVAIYEKK